MQKFKETKIDGVTLYTKNNILYIVHFFDFLTASEIEKYRGVLTSTGYDLALKRGRLLGWSEYKRSDFGGGLYKYSNDPVSEAKSINDLKTVDHEV